MSGFGYKTPTTAVVETYNFTVPTPKPAYAVAYTVAECTYE